MFDSSRPVSTMRVTVLGCHSGDCFHLGLRSGAVSRVALGALALLAGVLPASAGTKHATKHSQTHLSHAAVHAAAPAGTSGHKAAERHATSTHGKGSRGAAGKAEIASSGSRSHHGGSETATARLSRANKAGSGKSIPAKSSLGTSAAGRSSAGRPVVQEVSAPVPSRKGSRHSMPEQPAPAASASRETTADRKASEAEEDPSTVTLAPRTVADKATQDRVHAWYRAHHPQEVGDTAETSAEADSAAGAVATSEPDLSRTPRKATAEDFYRAAATQAKTIQAANEQNLRQTTAADDEADAESRIPRTAPTERTPAPFVHGEFPSLTAKNGRSGAPIVRENPVRQSSGVQSAGTQNVSPLKTGGAGLVPPGSVEQTASGVSNPAVAGAKISPAVPAATLYVPRIGGAGIGKPTSPVSIAGGQPVETGVKIRTAVAEDSSSDAVRAIAEEDGGSQTPSVRLPGPPTEVAAAAARNQTVENQTLPGKAKKPRLDASVTAGMSAETFDGEDDAPVTARTAARLANGAVRPVAEKDDAEDDSPQSTVRAAIPVNLYDGHGRLLTIPAMKGSHEILVHQNQMAQADGLERILDNQQMREMRRSKQLLSLPDDDSIYPNDRLPLDRRYARPWVVVFLREMARAHYARFRTPLIVTSAARTVAFQKQLIRVNGNAAPPTGDVASPHLYGQAVDIAKRSMSLTELTWMRAYLTPIENDGKIDVEEEFQQACFHVSVYRRYLGAPPSHKVPQTRAVPSMIEVKAAPAPEKKKHRLPSALLATGLR